MMYTQEELDRMVEKGEISRGQANRYRAKVLKPKQQAAQQSTALPPRDQGKDSLIDLSEALKLLSKQIDGAIANQGDAVAAIRSFLPVMVETYKAVAGLKITAPDRPSLDYEINAERDHRGLIQFPIRIKAVQQR